MIEGSVIREHVAGVWACELISDPPGPGMPTNSPLSGVVSQVGYALDNTTKTRAIFEINKGVNKDSIDVNARMSAEEGRIPVSNMIYVADGPSWLCSRSGRGAASSTRLVAPAAPTSDGSISRSARVSVEMGLDFAAIMSRNVGYRGSLMVSHTLTIAGSLAETSWYPVSVCRSIRPTRPVSPDSVSPMVSLHR